jgi:hypothetical protein
MMNTPSVGTIPSVQQGAARQLPAKPNLEHLKNEAKQRLDALRVTQPTLKLADAQHQLAREYGFANWRDLKTDIDQRAGGALSPAAKAAIGDWIGQLSTGTRVALHIRAGADANLEGGGLTATTDTPDYGFFGFVAEDVVVDGDRLSFSVVTPLVVGFQQNFYEARFDAERDRWIGEWMTNGMTAGLDLVRGAYPPAPRFEGLDGFWDARLESERGFLRLIFRIKTDAHGTYAWLDSPDRNLLGRPAVSVAREGRQVTIVMHTVTITGELSDDGQWIVGQLIKDEVGTPVSFIRRPPGAAPPLPQRAPAIDLPPEALAAFAGRYEMDGGTILTVTVEDGRLWIQFTGGPVQGGDGVPRVQFPSGPKLDLAPSAPTKFFWRMLDANVEFTLDDAGAVTGLIRRQIGAETRAKRVG